MTKFENYNVVDLSQSELKSTEGGFLPYVLAGITIVGACYATGYALGEAYYHATH